MNTDLKHYLYFSFCTAARILLSTIAMAILARFLDPSGLGRWTMLIAAATLFHTLFANWLQQDPFVRFGKQEWIETGTLRKTWGTRLPLLGAGGLLCLLAFTLLWNVIRNYFQLSPTDGLLAFGYYVSLLISVDMQTLLQITGGMDRLALGPVLIAGGLVPLYFGLRLSQLPSHRVEVSLFGTILVTVGVWIGVSYRAFRKSRPSFSAWDPVLAKTILRFSGPILPTTLLGYLVNWGNQVLIHRSFSNHEVGLYQSAFQVHGLLVSLAIPFTTILLPRLIDRHLADPTAMKRFVETIAPTLFSLWLLAVIPAVAILPWFFIRVYGVTFAASIHPLTALLIGSPFCALGQIYTGLFAVQGKLGKVFWIILTMVTTNFLGAWILVPHDRITLSTVALAFSGSFVLFQFLVLHYQHRTLRLTTSKMMALFLTMLAFSVLQSFLFSWPYRLLWSVGALGVLVGVIRQMNVAERSLVNHLFTGRLAPLGAMLEKLLIRSSSRAPGTPA